MKKVCYTAIGGSYDIPKPFKKTEGWEYILFSNVEIPKELHNGWTVILDTKDKFDNTRFARYHKHNPHKVLKDYDSNISIWVDANLTINVNLDELLDKIKFVDNKELDFICLSHPHRNCIYAEAIECKKQKKDFDDIIDFQISEYKKEGLPENFGMIQSGILIRKHKQENVISFQEQWWYEVYAKSKRDQLSFNYIQWKNEKLLNLAMLDGQVMLFNPNFFPIQPHKNGW